MYIKKKYDSMPSQKLKITKIDENTFEYKFNYDVCVNHIYFEDNVLVDGLEKRNNTFRFVKKTES